MSTEPDLAPVIPLHAAEGQPLYQADPARVLLLLSQHQFEDAYLAFRELYANALDAVRGREGRIVLEVGADRVVVEDDGPGLDEAGLSALTTLGKSTRRGTNSIGRFGIGFASIFDRSLGVARVVIRSQLGAGGVELRFVPGSGGEVHIERRPAAAPRRGGCRVEVHFDANRAPPERVARITELFEVHAAYSGVPTQLGGRRLGKDLSAFVQDELRSGRVRGSERRVVEASAVVGAVGVAAIDPSRSDVRFRAYQRGLFVCELSLPRPEGRPWPRGVFGAVSAEGLDVVASRNGFVENEAFARMKGELLRLAGEAAYRLLRHFETSGDAYARVVLLDALRRGLRTAAPVVLAAAEPDDLFWTALVRCPLFEAWGEKRMYAFEELVALEQQGRFRALPYRPAAEESGPILKSVDPLERDIFRKLSGLREMPAAARGEEIARLSWWSRWVDRFLTGPRAEYSLFDREVGRSEVPEGARDLVEAVELFLHGPEARRALGRVIPGPLPRFGFGRSHNAFGPVAAYRQGEVRFNFVHRAFARLARHPDPEQAARALLPIVAHELAHQCHELHDLDFYRTSRAVLRALVAAAAEVDARALDRAAEGL